jgi:hypothetical protein
VLFRKEGYSPLFLNASRVKLISGFQTPMQVTTSCRHDHNSLILFSSVVVTEGHEQLIPFIRTYPDLTRFPDSRLHVHVPTSGLSGSEIVSVLRTVISKREELLLGVRPRMVS